MRTPLPLLACLTMLSACGDPNRGYYDANGNYVPPPNATSDAQRTHAPDPGHTDKYGYRDHYRDHGVVKRTTVTTTYTYDRPGYYDYYGDYTSFSGDLNAPAELFPPRGMCRVWFPERAIENQPAVESCDGIRARVPDGAYVIYGG